MLKIVLSSFFATIVILPLSLSYVDHPKKWCLNMSFCEISMEKLHGLFLPDDCISDENNYSAMGYIPGTWMSQGARPTYGIPCAKPIDDS
jgi:hypothetical protein